MNHVLLLSCAAAALITSVTAASAQPAAPVASAATAVPNNPLLAEWTGPFGGVPAWDKVKPELFPEAFQFAIDEQRAEYQAIAKNPAPPTIDNTIAAL